MNKQAQIILKSEADELNKAVAFIENICDEHSIYNSYFGNILTAVTEAFQNAVQHGNKNDSTKHITLSFEVQGDGFAFCISDQGDGFDFNSITDPTDIDAEENAGRGIFLIDILSDSMEFRNGGRSVCMKFLISSINREISEDRINKFKAFINQGIVKKEII